MLLLQLFFHAVIYFFIVSFKPQIIIEKNSCKELYLYPISGLSNNCYNNPNVDAKTDEIIARAGYEAITYGFVTKDGYILNIIRIPPKNMNPNATPVFLQHGINADANEFVQIGNRSLAFNLADQGYDVWLGNTRGTPASRAHMIYEHGNDHYFNYNLDHLAKFDIAKSLQVVAEETGKPGEIIFIGYSLGSTLGMMYASEYPKESKTLLKGIIAMSPIVYFEPQFLMKTVLEFLPHYGKIMNLMGQHMLNNNPEKVQKNAQSFCQKYPYICINIIQLSDGKSYQFRAEDLLLYFSHFPVSVSLQQFVHYGQLYKTDRFQKFDYGEIQNYQVYNQLTSPLYNLSSITLPVSLYYGKKDGFITENAVQRIFNELGGKDNTMSCVPLKSTRKEDQFVHNDFVYAANIQELFYKDLFGRLLKLKAS